MSRLKAPYPLLPRRHLLAWLGAFPLSLWAAEPVQIQGAAPGGQRIALNDFRQRVVLVFYWSTSCPVCRDKMRELRANLSGWKNQPFTLLGVNMDPRREDFVQYEAIVDGIVPPEQRFISLWGKDPAYLDTLGTPQGLPSAVLIDKQGRVAQRYSGRIPAEAWDHIADLL